MESYILPQAGVLLGVRKMLAEPALEIVGLAYVNIDAVQLKAVVRVDMPNRVYTRYLGHAGI